MRHSPAVELVQRNLQRGIEVGIAPEERGRHPGTYNRVRDFAQCGHDYQLFGGILRVFCHVDGVAYFM